GPGAGNRSGEAAAWARYFCGCSGRGIGGRCRSVLHPGALPVAAFLQEEAWIAQAKKDAVACLEPQFLSARAGQLHYHVLMAVFAIQLQSDDGSKRAHVLHCRLYAAGPVLGSLQVDLMRPHERDCRSIARFRVLGNWQLEVSDARAALINAAVE